MGSEMCIRDSGKTETAEIIVNRSEHIIVEPLASGKHTEVNPMGFTIVVEENGHNPNHSYYDIQLCLRGCNQLKCSPLTL